MIAWMRRVPWYYWIAAVLFPGGALLLYFGSKNKAVIAKNMGPAHGAALPGSAVANAVTQTQNLVDTAKAQAETLRNSLKDDPLAASIVGVSPSLISAGTPTDVAARSGKIADIDAQIAGVQKSIDAQNAGWNADHAGGQSPRQFQAILDGLSAKMSSLYAQRATLQ